MEKFLKVAEKAIKTSGTKLIGYYDKFDRYTVKLKSHHEIITKCDLVSEEIIIKELARCFPGHAVLSEEKGCFGNKDSEYLWIIDPIDGTTNFSMHNPMWSISIGLSYRDELIMGLVYAPMLKELFFAQKDKGAFLNSKKIKVSSVKEGKVLNTFCHGTKSRDIKKALDYYRYQKLRQLDCRQLGSAAIELAYVACGRIESIMIPGAHLWDIAGGIVLVRESGGKVTDFKGKNWQMESNDILATNGSVHNMLLKAINK